MIDAPIYLLHVLVTVTLLIVGLLLIVDGIDEAAGPRDPSSRHQH